MRIRISGHRPIGGSRPPVGDGFLEYPSDVRYRPRPGWDNRVLEEMRHKPNGKREDSKPTEWEIPPRLHEFWDAGIRSPDLVWAATGAALGAYSKHPVVKKANDPGKTMGVSESLFHVRRMVVDLVVGRVLAGDLSACEA